MRASLVFAVGRVGSLPGLRRHDLAYGVCSFSRLLPIPTAPGGARLVKSGFPVNETRTLLPAGRLSSVSRVRGWLCAAARLRTGAAGLAGASRNSEKSSPGPARGAASAAVLRNPAARRKLSRAFQNPIRIGLFRRTSRRPRFISSGEETAYEIHSRRRPFWFRGSAVRHTSRLHRRPMSRDACRESARPRNLSGCFEKRRAGSPASRAKTETDEHAFHPRSADADPEARRCRRRRRPRAKTDPRCHRRANRSEGYDPLRRVRFLTCRNRTCLVDCRNEYITRLDTADDYARISPQILPSAPRG